MKLIPGNRNAALTICIITLTVLLLARCVNNNNEKKTAVIADKITADQFSGSESCASCHKNIYDQHILTSHYLTTRPALKKYIKGSFEPGKNIFAYDSERVVAMEQRDSSYWQVGYLGNAERVARRMDIVVGSGAKGQTYINRYQNQFLQLPVSYFTASHSWANSPLYPTHPILFNRPITSRCLECHSTFANKISEPNKEPEEFDAAIIYGVDCEKCHGPAKRHVDFQTKNPRETKGQYIINPATFSKEQMLDLCALCHGGRLKKTKPSFSYIPGNKLSDYFIMDTSAPDPAKIDVHGNQLGLMRSSKCFKMSQSMTCVTCHDPHKNERGNIVLFSQRCMSCHNSEHNSSCKMSASMGTSINNDCINCHMPLRASNSITELLPGDKTPTSAMIRSHYISIYPEETAKYKIRTDKSK